jgi:hypothetical protein
MVFGVFPLIKPDRQRGSSKNPSFPRKRESSSLFLLGPRLRGDDESRVFRGAQRCNVDARFPRSGRKGALGLPVTLCKKGHLSVASFER